jgi:hypothetical protein
MAQGRFAAQVSAFVAETKERMDLVHKESTSRVISLMQMPVGAGGNMPVDTGFLRASLVAGIGKVSEPTRRPPETDAPVSWDASAIDLVIMAASITDPIEARYTAVYARKAEYGGENRPARRFVALAAQQWPRIVNEVCVEAQARAGG